MKSYAWEHITEAHEAKDPAHALQQFTDIAIKYIAGEETMGVFDMYYQAARDLGIEPYTLRAIIAQCRKAREKDAKTPAA